MIIKEIKIAPITRYNTEKDSCVERTCYNKATWYIENTTLGEIFFIPICDKHKEVLEKLQEKDNDIRWEKHLESKKVK
jgi:hypothetical protein